VLVLPVPPLVGASAVVPGVAAMSYEPVDRGPLDDQFWINFGILAQYQSRTQCRYTIGSEMRPARRNPHYRPGPVKRAPVRQPPPPPKPPAQVVKIPRQRKPPPEPKPVQPVKYGQRDGRTAGGAIPQEWRD
jgi:hypothetical protein